MSTLPSEKQLLKALKYPTSVIRKEIDVSWCRHSGAFQREEEECITCYQTPECEWLLVHDHSSGAPGLNFSQMVAALQFACDYMHARLTIALHDPAECPCEGCTWWRKALELLNQAQEVPA